MAEDKITTSSEEELSAWNLSQSDIFFMSELWRRSTLESLSGNSIQGYYTMKELRYLFYTDLSEKENKILDILQKLIQREIQRSHKGTSQEKEQFNRAKFNQYFDRYKKKIRLYQKKYGYLMSKRKSLTNVYD